MRVFIGWSGDRGKQFADTFGRWLQDVIQALEPWVSTGGIKSGDPWFTELLDELSKTEYGIICMTPEAVTSPYTLFEAGAVSKGLTRQRVCPYLVDLEPTSLPSVLGHFQHRRATKQDTLALVNDLNTAGPNRPADQVARQFERCWPDLEAAITVARQRGPDPGPKPPSDRQILEEILATVRSLRSSAGISPLSKEWIEAGARSFVRSLVGRPDRAGWTQDDDHAERELEERRALKEVTRPLVAGPLVAALRAAGHEAVAVRQPEGDIKIFLLVEGNLRDGNLVLSLVEAAQLAAGVSLEKILAMRPPTDPSDDMTKAS